MEVLAAGVYWIHLEHIYDIAFRQGVSIEQAAQRAISYQEDPEKVEFAVYKSKDWVANEEINECVEVSTLNIAIHINGETQSRIVGNIIFLRRKNIEMNFFFWTRVLELVVLINSGFTKSLTGARLEI